MTFSSYVRKKGTKGIKKKNIFHTRNFEIKMCFQYFFILISTCHLKLTSLCAITATSEKKKKIVFLYFSKKPDFDGKSLFQAATYQFLIDFFFSFWVFFGNLK